MKDEKSEVRAERHELRLSSRLTILLAIKGSQSSSPELAEYCKSLLDDLVRK